MITPTTREKIKQWMKDAYADLSSREIIDFSIGCPPYPIFFNDDCGPEVAYGFLIAQTPDGFEMYPISQWGVEPNSLFDGPIYRNLIRGTQVYEDAYDIWKSYRIENGYEEKDVAENIFILYCESIGLKIQEKTQLI